MIYACDEDDDLNAMHNTSCLFPYLENKSKQFTASPSIPVCLPHPPKVQLEPPTHHPKSSESKAGLEPSAPCSFIPPWSPFSRHGGLAAEMDEATEQRS
ncbi:hypothetical protein M440DRAFT_221584 [Trichoderma longibrachiatum ATCC 18648]|uniref:Uncharacterized protein n=1 Tax=Trichoderma longibrachiatum ATCC 18648 TaxID=983965 RepID=A0A2T4BPG9_TRILO|nr:hypothetical protein M440DRAFT_221584 [Trichoderma longibrachiatum ATCC 18648]